MPLFRNTATYLAAHQAEEKRQAEEAALSLRRDALATGTVLNGYRILGVLGRGGFNITYRASDLLDQSFAIKEFFPRQFAMRSGHDVVVTSESDQAIFVDWRKRFLTEARLLSALGRNGGTPGVVRVAHCFEANNTAYSVMELLAGETLDDLLGAGVFLSPQVLFSLLRGILTPLARVHAEGFLHRDIKPSNILIRPDGQPVLIDFGSAQDMRPTANTTCTQVNSSYYSPIEQMIHGAPLGPYSDIYSVGAIAYRAIGGEPVDARSRQRAMLTQEPDPLVPAVDVGRGRYPAPLLHAIDCALAVVAKDRPQRVEDMLALLEAITSTFDRSPMPAARMAEQRREIKAAGAVRMAQRRRNKVEEGKAVRMEEQRQRGDSPAEQHRMGSILWTLPQRMRVGQRERVEVRLGDAGVAESQLRAGLKGRSLPETDKLEVAPLMRVTLVSDVKDFEISSLSSPDQYMRPNSVARWDFYATPLRGGTRTLRILVSIRVKIGSKDEIVDLPSYERDVTVAVAPFHATARFISKNWQWAAGTVLIPPLVWVATKTDAGSALLKQVIGGFSAK